MILIVITAVQVGEPAVQLEGLGWYLQAAAAAAAALGLQDDVAALAAGGEGSEGGEEEGGPAAVKSSKTASLPFTPTLFTYGGISISSITFAPPPR